MPSPSSNLPSIGLIGGTGPEGRGLAARFARAGHRIVIGSRSPERAQAQAAEMISSLPGAEIRGGSNEDAARSGEIVLLTIPYGGVADTIPPLAPPLRGKIVVSTIAPIEFINGRPTLMEVEAGSAAQVVQDLLPQSIIVSAFQIIDSHQLSGEGPIETDVLVCSDDAEARRAVMTLAREIPGVRAHSAGRLSASQFVEPATGLLITLNRIYKAHTGIRITGLT